jgi:superfamily I DNA/RNA helicase/mRNA-degrading endonuclease RelE of RelBE toxin-antitoxin system
MDFLIADSFEDSLARLTGDEQKAAKLTVYDLQTNPENPGLNYEKLNKPKDKRFRSVRVNRDIRIIVHKMDNSLAVCYVHHHEQAYDWAGRRRLDAHPKTGAAQLVEVRETVREVPVIVQVPQPTPSPESAPLLFAGVSDENLLGYGVPAEWLPDVRAAVDHVALEQLAEHLPAEAMEALWDLATGGTPATPVHAAPGDNPFTHPDAKRRFLMVTTEEELQRALDYPWEKWTIFLHPNQRELVTKSFNGPARVAGSAGTGKTVVALHRAAHLSRENPQARLLLTTFSDTLAGALRMKLARLLEGEDDVSGRIDVEAIDEVGMRVYREAFGEPQIADAGTVTELLRTATAETRENKFSELFIESEWSDVVDQWQLESWEAYRDVARLGRKTGLREEQRAGLWRIFEKVRERLAERGLATMPQIFARGAEAIAAGSVSPFDFAVVDEAQDISVPQLRFLAAAAGNRPDGLFFAGDLGQRIFQTPFSWKSLGVDLRGRSKTLRVNYRTSHEIRRYADRLLPPELSDVDGNPESRRGTVSVFSGAPPAVAMVDSIDAEVSQVADWLKELTVQGLAPGEMGVFVRSGLELDRARDAVRAAGLEPVVLDGSGGEPDGRVAVGIMELAKGLEFRAVAVAACDDSVIPSQARIDEIGDYADLDDVWETERQLLYVACTRARDHLLVTGVNPGSEFLEDLLEERKS